MIIIGSQRFIRFSRYLLPSLSVPDLSKLPLTLYLLSFPISALSDKFIKYMEALKPFLLAGLANRAEYQVGCPKNLLPWCQYFTILESKFFVLEIRISSKFADFII